MSGQRILPEVGRARAAKAAAWSAVDLIGRQGVTIVLSVILARLLTPADFGAVALAAFFALLATVPIQNAISTTIVQRHDASNEEVSSLFWWNLILNAALAAALIAASPVIARYFALPVLEGLIIAAAAQIVLTATGTVHSALLTRELRFAAIAKAGIPATLVSGVIGVLLAFGGAGVWALAAQLVMAAALNSIALWLVSAWRPAFVLRSSGLVEAARFARWVGLSGGLEVLYTQGSGLVIGKLYGTRDLGLYARAYTTQQVPATVITGIISRVVLPLLTRRRDDLQAMRSGLLAANRVSMTVTLPALVGLALTSDLVIKVLYGAQWNGAAPVLAILAWAGIAYPLSANNLQVILASGRSDTYFAVEIAKKVVGVVSVVIGSWFGIIGLAWSQLIFSGMAILINAWPCRRYFNCGVVDQLYDLSGLGLVTAMMGAAVVVLRHVTSLPPLPELAACVAAGAAVYVGAGTLFRIQAFSDAVAIAGSLMKREAAQ